jgi:hypothetical protein
MNSRVISILTVLILTIVTIMPLTDSLTKLVSSTVYARNYYGTTQLTALQNECSSEDGSTNCANNNAETLGDENNINPQTGQQSYTKPGQIGQPVLGANLVFGRTDMIIPPNQAAGATADCPPDTVAISGAFHGSGAPGIFIYGNKFTGADSDIGTPPTGWFVGAFNTGTESQSFTVWSICAPIIV